MNLRNLSVSALTAITGAAMLAGCTAADGDPSATASPETTASPTTVAGPPPGRPDPCDLVSVSRLSELTGTEMAAGVFSTGLSDSGRSVCEWRPADEEKSQPRVAITVNWGFPDIAEHRALAEEIYGESKDFEVEGASAAYALTGYRTIGMEIDEYFVKVSYIQPGNRDGGHVNDDIAHEVAANFPG